MELFDHRFIGLYRIRKYEAGFGLEIIWSRYIRGVRDGFRILVSQSVED